MAQDRSDGYRTTPGRAWMSHDRGGQGAPERFADVVRSEHVAGRRRFRSLRHFEVGGSRVGHEAKFQTFPEAQTPRSGPYSVGGDNYTENAEVGGSIPPSPHKTGRPVPVLGTDLEVLYLTGVRKGRLSFTGAGVVADRVLFVEMSK